MPGRSLSINAAAVSLIAICILSAAILVAVTSSDHPAVMAASSTAVHLSPYGGPEPGIVPVRTIISTTDAPAASPVDAPAAKVATISGCLVRDGQAFRLKNTAGAKAPKARSWKSGFLHKSASTVDLVDKPNSLKLGGYVDQQVSVTGVLAEREMQGRSIRRLSRKCT
jgi:hypothetical protein